MPFWFLAPDFTFRRNGPIRLGTILMDPLLPTLVLASRDNGLPADLELPSEGKLEETNHEYHRDAGASGGLKLWADFLQLASGSVEASAEVSRARSFGKVDHEVWSFDSELGDACLKAIVAVPKIRKHIDSGFLRRKDVYIIMGVRIAKTSFIVSTTSETTLSNKISASATIPAGSAVPVTAGGEENARVTREGEVSEQLFSSKKAFMAATGGSNIECVGVTPQVLRDGFEEKVEVLEHSAGGEDVWISVQPGLPGHTGGGN